MIFWLPLVGCGTDGKDGARPPGDTGDTAVPTVPTLPTTTPPPDPCRAPLTLAPETPGVLPLQGTRFVATGGSGTYTFAFVTNASGGRLAALSGEYLAGPTAGVFDEVRVDDPDCGGSATASVEVLGDMAVSPASANVPPNTSFTLVVTGGSGSHTCTPGTLNSGGSLAGCTWTGGAREGTDVVHVTDDATGEQIDVSYTVDAEAAVSAWSGQLYLPPGTPLAPPLRGGTGVFDLVPDRAGLDAANGLLTGVTPGHYRVVATDHFVPALSTTFDADVVAWSTAPALRDAERMAWGAFAAADLDGDGDDEVVFGTPDVSVSAHDSGGLFVYDPSAGAAPVLAWGAAQEFAATGRDVAVGDPNADGIPDLLVGSDTWDQPGFGDVGRIDVFYGHGGGAFSPAPDLTLFGEASGDRLGHGLVVCDVDGDGVDDVVASALSDDDPAAVGFYNQGSISVFRGSPAGVDPFESGKVHAMSPFGGVLGTDADANLGRRLVAGDWDDDGRCDVVATSHNVNLDGAGNDGVAWLFGADDLLGSGPPRRVFSFDEADDNVQGGRNAAMGDVDGDGRDDLALTGWTADRGGNTRGAVFLFLAADDDGRPVEQPVWLREASFVIDGDDDYDQFGASVALSDVDGDGLADVLVGAQYDELDGGTGSLGSVRVFPAANVLAGPLASTSDAATLAAVGLDVNDSFGTELAAADVDGDGDAELVTYASRDDGEGIEAGGVWVVETDATTSRLSLPGAAAGQQLGDKYTLGWADVDGDGLADPVGGAWGAPRSPDGYDSGLLHGFGGGSTAPTVTWQGFPNHSANDRFGGAVDGAGDFDGDGWDDLAVVMPQESRPSTFSADFGNPSECPGSVSNSGALWILPGGPAGIGAVPAFVFYGATSGDRLEGVAGGFDHDGDGYGDVAVGSTQDGTGNEGGLSVVHGRPRGTGITVICSTPAHWLGVTGGSRLGVALAQAGDLDGDGCDELVAGADADDLGFGNQGSVRVLWGYGAGCAHAGSEVTTLGPLVANERVGTGLDGGRDVDRDGVPDVVVGGYDHEETAGVDVGAVWLLSGAWLSTLPRQSASPLPADLSTTVTALPAAQKVVGDQRDQEFGAEVALVEDPTNAAHAWVAAGWRLASLGAAANGGVALYDWRGGAFVADPVGLVLGEPGAQLGDALRGAPDAPTLLVGAPLSDAGALDAGAFLAVPLR